MIRALQDRIAANKDASGFSLIELMVSVMILAILMGVVTGTLILTQQSVTNDAGRLDQGQQATVAEEAMTKALRTAVLPKQLDGTCTTCDVAAFISGDVRSLQFYANINNLGIVDSTGKTTDGPSKVTYAVDTSGNLRETVQRPVAHLTSDFNYTWCDPTLSTCAKTTRIVSRNVSTTLPLFTFYDKTGTAIALPIATANLPTVDSIDLSLSVRTSTRANATTIITRVTMPNADTVISTVGS